MKQRIASATALILLVLLVPARVSAQDAATPAPPAPPADPCASPDHRAFDFWVGEWEVFLPDGRQAGSSVIEARLNGCAIHESWTSATGGHGNSYNFLDAARGVWHQTWIDAQGNALYIEGGPQGDSMVLSDGVNRITWTPLASGHVRQHWEVTQDEGATWTTAFDGEYRRR
jgi:hypothetical protein